MSNGNAKNFDQFLDELASEEKNGLILNEKIDLMSRVAIENLREMAGGSNMVEKGAALLALVAIQDESCTELALKFMNDYNLDLKLYGIQAAQILKKSELTDKVEELLLDNSASIRIKALMALVALRPANLERRLAVVLNDPVWFVRVKMASLLSENGLAVGLLEQLQRDPNSNVRKSVFISKVAGL